MGIGDDGAVLRAGAATDWVVTTDAFIDGVHFLGEAHPADSVGYKALARATSDILAAGESHPPLLFSDAGDPRGPNRRLAKTASFEGCVARLPAGSGLGLAGGDTTRSKFVAVTVTVIGEVSPQGRQSCDQGAEPGGRRVCEWTARCGGTRLAAGAGWARRRPQPAPLASAALLPPDSGRAGALAGEEPSRVRHDGCFRRPFDRHGKALSGESGRRAARRRADTSGRDAGADRTQAKGARR